MANETLDFQKEFDAVMKDKVNSALKPKLDGDFICATYPAGFNYGITYGVNAYYNEDTLSTLDSTIQTNDDGITSISNQKLSDLYQKVMKVTTYKFSKATSDDMQAKDNKLEAQIAAVLTAFTNSGFTFSNPLPPGGKIADVFDQLTVKYGAVDKSCDCLPSYLALLRDALSTYNEMAGDAYIYHSRYAQAVASLSAAQNNIKTPTQENGGLQTGDSSYYVGFDKLPTANQLIGSLSTDGNALSIHLAGDSFSSSNCNIHVEDKNGYTIPIAFIIGITFSDSSEFDMSNLTYDNTSFSMDVTYPGLTVVGNIPLSLSSNNAQGWYDTNALTEIKDKSGKDVDGIQLDGSEFSVEELFGFKGRLNFFKTFVISREPTIDVTFKNVDIDKVKQHIHKDSSVKVKLFGFIPIGSSSESYSLDTVDYNESEMSVTLHFSAPNVSGTIPLQQQVAHVLGGVPTYND